MGQSALRSELPGFHVGGDGAALSQPFKPFIGVIEKDPVFGFIVGLCGVGH